MTDTQHTPTTDSDASNPDESTRTEETVAAEQDPIEILKKERDEYLSGWRRAKADYENLLRDTQRAKEEYVKFANEQALLRLLPAIDQYDVALSFAPSFDVIPQAAVKPFENWMIGLEAVRSLWIEAARELGLEKIAVTGVFNPNLHEAVGDEVSETVPAGQIIRATVNGWTLNGKVIRAAKVIVSKNN